MEFTTGSYGIVSFMACRHSRSHKMVVGFSDRLCTYARGISRVFWFAQLNGKVLGMYVKPACQYGPEAVPMTEHQRQRLHVCEEQLVPEHYRSNDRGYKFDE